MMQPPTIFCDLDGTLVYHEHDSIHGKKIPVLIPGTLEKLKEWKSKGCVIVITTGRPAPPEVTQAHLKILGIPYDHLVMGATAGPRIVINDKKVDGSITVNSFNPDRNIGIASINI